MYRTPYLLYISFKTNKVEGILFLLPPKDKSEAVETPVVVLVEDDDDDDCAEIRACLCVRVMSIGEVTNIAT